MPFAGRGWPAASARRTSLMSMVRMPPLNVSSLKRCHSAAVSAVGHSPLSVSTAISSLSSHARIPATSMNKALPSRIAALAARREGNPARTNIAIINWGTPVSKAAASPPALISGDHPSMLRLVRSASNAQTSLYINASSTTPMFAVPIVFTSTPVTHMRNKSRQFVGSGFGVGHERRRTSKRLPSAVSAETSSSSSPDTAASSARSINAPSSSAIASSASPASNPTPIAKCPRRAEVVVVRQISSARASKITSCHSLSFSPFSRRASCRAHKDPCSASSSRRGRSALSASSASIRPNTVASSSDQVRQRFALITLGSGLVGFPCFARVGQIFESVFPI